MTAATTYFLCPEIKTIPVKVKYTLTEISPYHNEGNNPRYRAKTPTLNFVEII